ncbi:AraC family transcriptional regulator [bacterium D16-50]|nr:AraC family transcriptional regulator [bacterium D16-50]
MNSFDLLWCGEYSQDWENEPHEHGFFQIILVTGGSARANADGQEWELTPGKLLLIRPRCPHGIRRGNAFHVYDAKFEVHDSGLLTALQHLPLLAEPEDFQKMKLYFQWIMREGDARQPFYPQIISSYFWMILIQLLRPGCPSPEMAAAETRQPQTYKGIHIQKVERFIRESYMRQITLEDLTALAGCSKTTLIQAFKEVYGSTPFGYIIQIRLQKAKELLVGTDAGISQISDLIGFQSVHYFSRFFKEKEGYSPMEFRAKYAGNRFLTF